MFRFVLTGTICQLRANGSYQTKPTVGRSDTAFSMVKVVEMRTRGFEFSRAFCPFVWGGFFRLPPVIRLLSDLDVDQVRFCILPSFMKGNIKTSW